MSTSYLRGAKLAVQTLSFAMVVVAVVFYLAVARDTMNHGEVREYLYRVANGYSQAGTDEDFGAFLLDDLVEEDSDAVRVLVLGDSYTFGWGLENLDGRWTSQAEIQLGSRYDLDVYALPGASIYTYASWAERLAPGRYDAVVVALTENDLVPGPMEVSSGQAYESLSEEEAERVSAGEGEDPNQVHLEEAVHSLERVAPTRVLVSLYGTNTKYWGSFEKVGGLLSKRGWAVPRMEGTRTTILRTEAVNLNVATFDDHPNEKLGALYAKDAVQAILDARPVPETGINGISLVGSISPGGSDISFHGEMAEIQYNPGDQPCIPVKHPQGLIDCETDEVVLANGGHLSRQHAPCNSFGGAAVIISIPRGAESMEAVRGEGLVLWEGTIDGVWRQVGGGAGWHKISPGARQVAVQTDRGGCPTEESTRAGEFLLRIR